MDTLETQEGARSFPSTHWSQIYLASDRLQEAGARALGELVQTYRHPLQTHLQYHFGASQTQAAEWLDAFIAERILARELLRRAAQAKGSFRAFLKTSLEHFVVDALRRGNTQRRRPTGGFVDYDQLTERQLRQLPPAAETTVGPLDRAWAVRVIEQAAVQTEVHYRSKGKGAMWEVFQHAIYLPLLHGAPRPSDATLAVQFGFVSGDHVSTALSRVKRRFGQFVREVVAEYVPPTANIDEEIVDLMAILAEETG
jgi:DNA-directed RNA polymerase specialized sigma24 family protein